MYRTGHLQLNYIYIYKFHRASGVNFFLLVEMLNGLVCICVLVEMWGTLTFLFCFFGEVLVVLVKEVWKRVVLLVGEVLQPTGQGQGHMTNKQLQ